MSDEIKIRDIKPEHNIVFSDTNNGKEVGRLSWDKGKFQFEGNADKSAKIFFDYLKGYVDLYLEEHKNET